MVCVAWVNWESGAGRVGYRVGKQELGAAVESPAGVLKATSEVGGVQRVGVSQSCRSERFIPQSGRVVFAYQSLDGEASLGRRLEHGFRQMRWPWRRRSRFREVQKRVEVSLFPPPSRHNSLDPMWTLIYKTIHMRTWRRAIRFRKLVLPIWSWMI